VVPLDVSHAVHGQVAREGNREIVAQGQDLAALVGQVVDELCVFAVPVGIE
jgi:hypothetical protein